MSTGGDGEISVVRFTIERYPFLGKPVGHSIGKTGAKGQLRSQRADGGVNTTGAAAPQTHPSALQHGYCPDRNKTKALVARAEALSTELVAGRWPSPTDKVHRVLLCCDQRARYCASNTACQAPSPHKDSGSMYCPA